MTTVVGTLTKDPQETRLFKMDWSAHIGTETILASNWFIPDGLTIETSGIVEGSRKTYCLLSGGTAGQSYIITNTISITGFGEIYQRSGKLDVREY